MMRGQSTPTDICTLENWLREVACSIRGPLDAPKYKDSNLPLLFFKCLCDVLDDEQSWPDLTLT